LFSSVISNFLQFIFVSLKFLLTQDLIDESFNGNNMTFKRAINEALEKSNDNDKKIMQETLHNLKIDYSSEKSNNINESVNNIEASNTGSELVMDLQEALKKNKDLEKQIAGLKDELSVCYAKDAKFNDLSDKYKSTVSKLSESLKSEKALKRRISILEQKVNDSDIDLTERSKEINRLTEQVSKLREKDSNKRNLTEDLIKKDIDIKSLREKLGKLNKNLENSEQIREKLEEKNSALEEEVASLNKDNAIKYSQYAEKLNKEKSITEKYKKIAKRAIEKYIGIQALRLGVSSSDITNRLSENYSFDDIDKVCENLKNYNINMSKLPFSTSNSIVSKVKLTESKNDLPIQKGYDDEVDDGLLALANIH
jgi:chromosome segregation ATPase